MFNDNYESSESNYYGAAFSECFDYIDKHEEVISSEEEQAEENDVKEEEFSFYGAAFSQRFDHINDGEGFEEIFHDDSPTFETIPQTEYAGCDSKKIWDMFKTPAEKEKEKEVAKEQADKNGYAKMLAKFADIIKDQEDFIFYNNDFFVYRSPTWRKITQQEFSTLAKEVIGSDVTLLDKDCKELWKMLITDYDIQIDNSFLKDSKYLINFADCVYDVRNGEIREHCKDDYSFTYIDVNLCDAPVNNGYFDKFVCNASAENEVGGSEAYQQEWRQLALEILGCIISGVNPKAFFVLYGEKSTGKSQFANFCQELLGKNLCTALRKPNDLARQFKTGDLFGKKLCSAADIPNSPISPEAVAAIKSLTGNDWIEGEQKYKNTFTFKNEASLLMSTNHKISIADGTDDAFFDRMVCLPFRNSVPREKQIKDLSEKFMEERTYIVKEALEALMNLIENNYVFTSVNFDENSLVRSVNVSDESVEHFIEECCIYDEGTRTTNPEIYEKYVEFCKTEGHYSESRVNFGKKFKPMIKDKFPSVREANTAEARGYVNFKLV